MGGVTCLGIEKGIKKVTHAVLRFWGVTAAFVQLALLHAVSKRLGRQQCMICGKSRATSWPVVFKPWSSCNNAFISRRMENSDEFFDLCFGKLWQTWAEHGRTFSIHTIS